MAEDGGLGSFAEAALKGAMSELGSQAIKAIFGSNDTYTLSEESYNRIRDIITDSIDKDKLNTLQADTKSVLDLLSDAAHDPKLDPSNSLLPRATEVKNRIAAIKQTGYLAAIPYWAAASALVCVHRLIYDRSAEPDSTNLANCAVDILNDLLNYERQMREREGLDVFSTFKRYTLGENPYDNLDASPLSYMGMNYRENVQRLLGLLDKCDPDRRNPDLSKRLLNQVPYPKYLIKFFDYSQVSDKVMHAWEWAGEDEQYLHKDACKFWMCFPIDEYQPLGDLCVAGRPGSDLAPRRVPYIRFIGEGKLAYPVDYVQKWRDHGTRNPVDLSGWFPVPPDGFSTIASVINQSEDDKPSGQRCVVVPKADVDMHEPGNRIWNSSGTGAEWEGATWRHPESAFGDAGLFIMARTLTVKPTETPVGVFKQGAVGGHPRFGYVPPPPDFDPGNWTETAGAYGTSGRWDKGYKVRYRVGFYSPSYGTIVGPWWHPTYAGGADSEGYYGGAPWACPTITNISTDPTERAIARIIYRQFFGRDPEVAGVILNNEDTRFLDKADVPPYGPPATAPTFDPGNWANSVPVAGSKNWAPGYKVRYAVSFYNASGETPMSPWWSPGLWPGNDSDGFYSGERWAWPALIDIPTDPTHTATGRRIYRQFSHGNLRGDIEMVHDINDNKTISYSDKNP